MSDGQASTPYLRFAAYSVIGTVTLMPLLVLPAMVGVLVDRAGMTDASAGLSVSFNFAGSAILGMLLALRMHHLDLRRATTLALAAAAVLDLVSAATAGPGVAFLFARALAGAALGAAYVSTMSAFARDDDYERGFGLFVTLQFIVSGLGLYLVPVFSEELGARGLFLAFAALDLLALCLAHTLPGKTTVPSLAERSGSELDVLLTMAAITGILGFCLFEGANNAQFTYIERFAVAQGIDEHRIGVALLLASLAGIPGAFMIVLIGERFGLLAPLVFGIGLGIAGLLVLILADGYAAFFAGGCCLGFSWAFGLPYIQSLLASLDRQGSVIAAGSSVSTLGSAAGPGLAAVVVGDGNYAGVFILAIVLFIGTIACFVVAAGHAAQTRRAVA